MMPRALNRHATLPPRRPQLREQEAAHAASLVALKMEKAAADVALAAVDAAHAELLRAAEGGREQGN